MVPPVTIPDEPRPGAGRVLQVDLDLAVDAAREPVDLLRGDVELTEVLGDAPTQCVDHFCRRRDTRRVLNQARVESPHGYPFRARGLDLSSCLTPKRYT